MAPLEKVFPLFIAFLYYNEEFKGSTSVRELIENIVGRNTAT
jgi:hypothetical protein